MKNHGTLFLLFSLLAACKERERPIQPASDAPLPLSAPCDKTRPGPIMVRVSTEQGATYCIDTTEVTQRQYADFLAQATSFSPSWPAYCEGTPLTSPPPETDTSFGCGEVYRPKERPDAPMGCVSWCQARAYCEWAGKRLCGRVGGGASTLETMQDPAKDEWFNACTGQGVNEYAYGKEEKEGTCYDKTRLMAGKEGTFESEYPGGSWMQDTSKKEGCHGEQPPFDAIYDMVGGVYEWTDICLQNGPLISCKIRGGVAGENGISCRSSHQTPLDIPVGGAGFRCCAN